MWQLRQENGGTYESVILEYHTSKDVSIPVVTESMDAMQADTQATYEFIAALRDVMSSAVISITSVSPWTETVARALSEGAESVSGSRADRTVSAT